MSLRKVITAAAVAGAFAVPTVAHAINVDGIVFNPGAIFETIRLFEGEDVRTNCTGGIGGTPVAGYAGNCNGFIDLPGEKLVGVGRISNVGQGVLDTWVDGQNGKELIVYFYDYLVEDIVPGTGSEATILFSGGKVELYSQAHGTFNPLADGTQQGAVDTVTGGFLWLALEGSPIGGFGTLTGAPITLSSVVDDLTGSGADVGGLGQLDVTGGAAAIHFDTNGFGCDASAGDPCPDISDKSFSSEGQLSQLFGTPSNPQWAFIGTGTVQDVAVPEPGVLALLGLGLAGLGAVARRKA